MWSPNPRSPATASNSLPVLVLTGQLIFFAQNLFKQSAFFFKPPEDAGCIVPGFMHIGKSHAPGFFGRGIAARSEGGGNVPDAFHFPRKAACPDQFAAPDALVFAKAGAVQAKGKGLSPQIIFEQDAESMGVVVLEREYGNAVFPAEFFRHAGRQVVGVQVAHNQVRPELKYLFKVGGGFAHEIFCARFGDVAYMLAYKAADQRLAAARLPGRAVSAGEADGVFQFRPNRQNALGVLACLG